MTRIDSGHTYQLFEKSKLTPYMHCNVNSDNKKNKTWIVGQISILIKLNSMRMDKRNDYNKKSNDYTNS